MTVMQEAEKHRLQRAREFILRCESNRELQINVTYASYKKLHKEFLEKDFYYPYVLPQLAKIFVVRASLMQYSCHLDYDYNEGILTIINPRVALTRARVILTSEGLPDEVVGSLHRLGNPTIHSLEPNMDMRTDASIFSRTDPLVPRIVFVGGVSLEYPYLWEKARKLLTGIRCKTVFLVSFREKNEFTSPTPALRLTVAEQRGFCERMKKAFMSTSKYQFDPLVFGGHIWYDQLQEVFVELVRRGSSEPDGLESSREVSKYLLMAVIDNMSY